MDQKRRKRAKPVAAPKPRRVLLAVDGSAAATRASAFALMLAAAPGTRLTAVYVRGGGETKEEAAGKFAATLAAAAAAGVKCEVVIPRPVGITNPGRRIVAAARAQRADMIVLGARGSGLVHKLLGSVSSYVVSHAPVSVTVVR